MYTYICGNCYCVSLLRRRMHWLPEKRRYLPLDMRSAFWRAEMQRWRSECCCCSYYLPLMIMLATLLWNACWKATTEHGLTPSSIGLCTQVKGWYRKPACTCSRCVLPLTVPYWTSMCYICRVGVLRTSVYPVQAITRLPRCSCLGGGRLLSSLRTRRVLTSNS